MPNYPRPQLLANIGRHGLGGRIGLIRVSRNLPLIGAKDELFILSKAGDAAHGTVYWWDDNVKAWTAIASPGGGHPAVTLAGAPDYITIADQVITRGLIDLATDVAGILADGNIAATITRDSEHGSFTPQGHHTQGIEGTLDDAYDYGGAGAGRTIYVATALPLRFLTDLATDYAWEMYSPAAHTGYAFRLRATGTFEWGPGDGTSDTNLYRVYAGRLGSSTLGLVLAAGTVGAPTYSFAVDPDTGLYRPAADTIGFVSAGVEMWRLLATGALAAQGADRAIQNVLDPVNDQDAATKIWALGQVTTHAALPNVHHFQAHAFDSHSDVPPITEAQGQIIYWNGTSWVALVPGASGKYLKTQGEGANPMWDTPAGGGSTPTGTGFRHVTAGVEDAAAKLVDTADINANQVTYAKMQSVSAASKLLGRGSAAGAGVVQEIALGAGILMSDTTLSATANPSHAPLGGYYPGVLSTGVKPPQVPYRGASFTIDKLYCRVSVAPQTTAITVEIRRNGTSMGTVTIAAAAQTGETDVNVAVASGDYFDINITATGSSPSFGSDLVWLVVP